MLLEATKMNSNQIYCTNCGTLVSAEDINIKAMVGKCSDCDHVFSIVPPSSDYSFDVLRENPSPGSGVPVRPKSITKEAGPGGELYLKRRWFTPKLFFLLFFCIAWDSFLAFFYFGALGAGNRLGFELLFLSGHLAVGVGLTYHVVAGFLNKTHIFTDQHTVIVNHRPIFWLGNKEMNAKDIKQLMVQRGKSYNDNGGQYETFDLMANVNGEEAKLLGGLEHSEAQYVGYELSKKLKVDLV